MQENNNTPETTPPVNSGMKMPTSFTAPVHHAHVGPILAVLIIMLVIIFGGLFLWGSMFENMVPTPTETPIVNNEPETPRADADLKILETVSPSDELDAIDADVHSTNLDSIDADLTAIDSEFNTAVQ